MSGGVMSYRHCLGRLGNRRKVYGLQYPGLVEGATSVMPFPELAARFAEVMVEVWPDGPYYLAGYSLGAQIAFATANHLRAAGKEVSLLALIDGPTRKGKVGGLRREARKLARGLFHLADVKVEHWPGYLLKSGGREIRRLWTKKRRKSKEPFTPTFASLIDEQSRLYSPPIYPGPVKVLRSTDDAEYFNRKYIGWDDFVTGPIEVFDISAHHANIMTEPRVALVSAFLECWLREADQARKSR
jgi:thioesterase domain-containing protein